MLKSRLASPPTTKALWSPPRGWSCPTSPSRPPLQSPLWLALAGASTRCKSWLGNNIHLNLSLDDSELEQAVGQERPDQGCHGDSACTFGVATFVWGAAAAVWSRPSKQTCWWRRSPGGSRGCSVNFSLPFLLRWKSFPGHIVRWSMTSKSR